MASVMFDTTGLLNRSRESMYDPSFQSLMLNTNDRRIMPEVPRRTILQAHRSQLAFKYKRGMEMFIMLDFFILALNFHFWVLYNQTISLGRYATKIEIALLFCVLPFLVAKIFCRFWPLASARLQAERCFAI